MTLALAFIRRDALNWLSYRLSVIWNICSTASAIVVLYLLWQAIGDAGSQLVESYSPSLIGFLVTGMVFLEIWAMAFLLPGALRDAQGAGTLEAIMLSNSGISRLLTYSSLFPILLKLTRTLPIALFAIMVMGLWQQANPLTVAVVVIVSYAPMACLGVLCVASVLATKQVDPIIALYGLVNALLAGIYFPKELLPAWIAPLSSLLPLTHAMHAVRLALNGASLADVAPQLVILSGMFIVLLPIAVWGVNWGMSRAKDEGSLVQY